MDNLSEVHSVHHFEIGFIGRSNIEAYVLEVGDFWTGLRRADVNFKQAYLLVIQLCVAAGAFSQQVVSPSGFVRFDGPAKPEVVAWAVEAHAEASVDQLQDDQVAVTLAVGIGCLALLRSGSIPILALTEIENGGEKSLADLEWQEGPKFVGSVVDPKDLPVPAVIRFKEEATPGVTIDDSCRKALTALGFYELRASSNGHFESPPLLSGRYALTIEAPDHETVERLLVVSGDRLEYDLGTITIKTVARVNVVVDVTDIDAPPPFELVVESERPEEIYMTDRWERVLEAEISPDTPVQVETNPGMHRLTLRKTGKELAFTALVEFSPGWQETVLRPEPIFIEGRVTADDSPIENAEVTFFWEGLRIKTNSDQDGDYEVTVWVPAHYGALVSAPDGGRQFDTINLEEAEPGETHELDFDLGLATIAGRVVAAGDQSPIEGCHVTLEQQSEDKGSHRSATTSAEGTFVFEGVWQSDSVTLHARAEGYLYREMDVAFVGEDVSNIWIELDESAVVEGWVVGPAGEPVAGIEVACWALVPDGFFTTRTATDQDGTFKITALPGEVLFARAAGYAIGWAIARDGEKTVIGLQGLSAPTRVRIHTEAGEPAVGVTLMYVSDSGVALPSNLVFQHAMQNGLSRATDAEGVIDIASLPPGVYQVSVRSRAGVSALGTLPIPSSGEVTFRVPAMKRLGDDQPKVALSL